MAPQLAAALAGRALPAKARVEDSLLFIEYEPLSTGTGYVAPAVMLEFGARSTGEPHEPRAITCDAAHHLTDVRFPEAKPQVMRPERTFWEKATAIHVFCAQGSLRGGARFARHWHDVTRLDTAGFADRAMADRTLADSVVAHKSIFFAESTPDGKPIDYREAVNGHLDLVPQGDARATLADDYSRMVADGLLLETTRKTLTPSWATAKRSRTRSTRQFRTSLEIAQGSLYPAPKVSLGAERQYGRRDGFPPEIIGGKLWWASRVVWRESTARYALIGKHLHAHRLRQRICPPHNRQATAALQRSARTLSPNTRTRSTQSRLRTPCKAQSPHWTSKRQQSF